MDAMEATTAAQYLTFNLEDELFAFDIATVREVLDYPVVTRIPRTPAYVRGVINLRGAVVPVIDLRAKFGMPKGADAVDGCVIISEVQAADGATILGVLADSVREVMNLNAGEIEPPPKFGRVDAAFIRGMGRQGERFIIILDIDRIVGADELDAVQAPRDAERLLAA